MMNRSVFQGGLLLCLSGRAIGSKRSLFNWIPDKIKYMIVPDKRTEKEKFLEEANEKSKKKIDDALDEMMGKQRGVLPFLIKKLIKSTGRSILKDFNRITKDSPDLRDLAENIIMNNARVQKVFGADVLVNDTVGFKSDQVMSQKKMLRIETIASLSGSRRAGTARIVGTVDEGDEMKLTSIIISDGHNEFEITEFTLNDASGRTTIGASASQQGAGFHKKGEKPIILDVKARDD